MDLNSKYETKNGGVITCTLNGDGSVSKRYKPRKTMTNWNWNPQCINFLAAGCIFNGVHHNVDETWIETAYDVPDQQGIQMECFLEKEKFYVKAKGTYRGAFMNRNK